MTDPILNQGETVIRKAGGREYLSFGRYTAWLTLTNQRLIIQRLYGANLYYPLSHVTKVGIFEYWPPLALISLSSLKLLRIDFDNGGTILFGLYEKPTWIQAIEQAKVSAPEMPYTSATPPLIPQSGARTPPWMLIVIAATSIIAFCTGTLILLGILIYFNSR